MIQKFVYRGMSRIFKSERRSLKKVGSGDEGGLYTINTPVFEVWFTEKERYSKPPIPLVMSVNGKF